MFPARIAFDCDERAVGTSDGGRRGEGEGEESADESDDQEADINPIGDRTILQISS
jgi:hypothetical protein